MLRSQRQEGAMHKAYCLSVTKFAVLDEAVKLKEPQLIKLTHALYTPPPLSSSDTPFTAVSCHRQDDHVEKIDTRVIRTTTTVAHG